MSRRIDMFIVDHMGKEISSYPRHTQEGWREGDGEATVVMCRVQGGYIPSLTRVPPIAA